MEGGILCYGRSYTHIQKRKILGSIDLGLAFINCDGNTRRIDIDGEQVYHLKVGREGGREGGREEGRKEGRREGGRDGMREGGIREGEKE